VWDAKTGEVAAGSFEGHTGPVMSVAFSPDGQKIVSGSYDQTVQVWDAKIGEVAAGHFERHTGPVRSVAFSPDGQQIVSGSNDQTMQVHNTSLAILLKDTAASSIHANQQADFVEMYNSSRLVHGWVQNKNSQLLFWLPPYYRRGLYAPNVIAVMGRHRTKLDFSTFVHGTSWTQCYSNPPPK
jgi:WD40 repeat protein